MTLERARPGLYRPGYHYTVLDEMVRELQIERTPEAQGLWLANIVQPIWELGKRYGLPEVREGTLDVFGQDAFMPGPAKGRRWLIVGLNKPVTTGATQLLVKPKASTDPTFRVGATETLAKAELLPWPGMPIEHQAPFDGGQVGLRNSGNAADTARVIQILFYDLEC